MLCSVLVMQRTLLVHLRQSGLDADAGHCDRAELCMPCVEGKLLSQEGRMSLTRQSDALIPASYHDGMRLIVFLAGRNSGYRTPCHPIARSAGAR